MVIEETAGENEMILANTDASNFVVMSNDMVQGNSKLSLNALKLLRIIIMQCRPADKGFYTYQISIRELAEMFGITPSNLYNEAKNLCKEVLKEVVEISDGNPAHKWKVFQWVSMCKYEEGIITIRLHDELSPYLLNLRANYTQYELANIMRMRSTYAIRIYELIRMKIYHYEKIFSWDGEGQTSIYVTMEELRKITQTENILDRPKAFERVVLDRAKQEIEALPTGIQMEYKKRTAARGRIIGYEIRISKDSDLSPERYRHIMETKERIEQAQKYGLHYL